MFSSAGAMGAGAGGGMRVGAERREELDHVQIAGSLAGDGVGDGLSAIVGGGHAAVPIAACSLRRAAATSGLRRTSTSSWQTRWMRSPRESALRVVLG